MNSAIGQFTGEFGKDKSGSLWIKVRCFNAIPEAGAMVYSNMDAIRLEWAMRNMSDSLMQAFCIHVMNVGGIGDISDMRVFLDSVMGDAT